MSEGFARKNKQHNTKTESITMPTLKVVVVQGNNLVAKDMGGTSGTYILLFS